MLSMISMLCLFYVQFLSQILNIPLVEPKRLKLFPPNFPKCLWPPQEFSIGGDSCTVD